MNLKVNYNNSQICSITEGSVILDTTNKYANSNTIVKVDDFSLYVSEHTKILKKPTVLTKTAIYNGSYISNGYSFLDGVTVTGDTGGVNAGTYTSTYTPKPGYMWDDGTTSTVIVILEICIDYITFWSPEPFIFAHYNSSTSSFTKSWDGELEYSTDKTFWSTWAGTSGPLTAVQSGDNYYLYLRGTNNTLLNTIGSSRFDCMFVFYKPDYSAQAQNIHITGNMETLLDHQTVANKQHPTMANYAFSYLFQYQLIVEVPTLPATTLSDYCYSGMFYQCTSLITPPELPATTLASYCYSDMFNGCTALTTPPALPATTLSDYCYSGMFYQCTSLITPPELPATTLAPRCYSNMFADCTPLTTPPALPATTLAEYCYSSMFRGCTALTAPPALPATTLATYCYYGMFRGCTALTAPPALPATTLASYCYSNMFDSCTALTTPPALPATTLAPRCYYYMFNGCTALTTPPALPATTLATYCYYGMFRGCTSLIVSDTSGSGYDKVWTIPTSGTFTNTYSQSGMFTNCAGSRSSDNMSGASGQSYTYYTQNPPVQ